MLSMASIAVNIMKLNSLVVDLTAGVLRYLMKKKNVIAITMTTDVEYITDITISRSSHLKGLIGSGSHAVKQ